MNTQWQADILCLTGDITVHTLTAERWRHYCQTLAQHKPQRIDLSGVGRVDSACLALLAESQRQYGQIPVSPVPESVHLLAQLYEIEPWINA